jgi:hypothetical protein
MPDPQEVAMTTWRIEEPQKLAFDEVRRLKVRAIRGSLSVVGTDDRPRPEVEPGQAAGEAP